MDPPKKENGSFSSNEKRKPALNRKEIRNVTCAILRGKSYDRTKIRRRTEEQIRKYGTGQIFIMLACSQVSQ